MLKQQFSRINKLLIILLASFFVASLVGVVTSAQDNGGISGSGMIENVTIQDSTYKPASLQISLNDTVRWTNLDSFNHTVLGTNFSSGNISSGKSYEHKFTETGTFNYYCTIDPSMKGVVMVK